MTGWLNSALERASNPITVNVADLGLEVDELQVKTLSAAEYQTLKANPALSKIAITERAEWIGLRTIFEMLSKCDDNLKWSEFQKLPLQLLSQLATRVTETVGNSDGGVLGN